MGRRTVFNILGPLTNPALAPAQVLGVYAADLVPLMAEAMVKLGVRHGFVVHGSDGLDEITTTGATSAWEIRDGALEARVLEPGDFGVQTASAEDLRGGDRRRHDLRRHGVFGLEDPLRHRRSRRVSDA